jgi:5-formyltetrahydrofolate cyclo-ligase
MHALKDELRKKMLEARRQHTKEYKRVHAQSICKAIWKYVRTEKVKTVHSYIPLNDEVDLLPLLQKLLKHDISLIVPKTLSNFRLQHLKVKSLAKLHSGLFRTKYPVQTEVYKGTYDLILVPGLCFDPSGIRLGYGKGYYDRFLGSQLNVVKAGVCFPFQVVEHIPNEDHDVKMDMIFSS